MAKELTQMQSVFLEVLFEETGKGVSLDDAKWVARDLAGYVDTTHPNHILRMLKEEIVERATEELAMKLPEVITKVGGVLKDPDQLGNKQLLDAATWIADRAGLIKKDQSTVTVKADQGIIIMPSKIKED